MNPLTQFAEHIGFSAQALAATILGVAALCVGAYLLGAAWQRKVDRTPTDAPYFASEGEQAEQRWTA